MEVLFSIEGWFGEMFRKTIMGEKPGKMNSWGRNQIGSGKNWSKLDSSRRHALSLFLVGCLRESIRAERSEHFFFGPHFSHERGNWGFFLSLYAFPGRRTRAYFLEEGHLSLGKRGLSLVRDVSGGRGGLSSSVIRTTLEPLYLLLKRHVAYANLFAVAFHFFQLLECFPCIPTRKPVVSASYPKTFARYQMALRPPHYFYIPEMIFNHSTFSRGASQELLKTCCGFTENRLCTIKMVLQFIIVEQ